MTTPENTLMHMARIYYENYAYQNEGKARQEYLGSSSLEPCPLPDESDRDLE